MIMGISFTHLLPIFVFALTASIPAARYGEYDIMKLGELQGELLSIPTSGLRLFLE
jgi:hypothetical protein